MADTIDIKTSAVAVAKPNGPSAAAMLAAGIGSLAMGLVTTLAEASTTVKDGLEWSTAVGPLSGKTMVAVAVFFASWLGLHLALRQRTVNLAGVFTATLILVALGVLGTLPTFFQLFAGE